MANANRLALPEQGMAWDELERELVEAKRDDVDWQGGRAPAFVHYAGEEVLAVSKKAFMHYFSENGLGLRAFHAYSRKRAGYIFQGGIELASGRSYGARVIACNASAKHLYLDLVGEQHLPTEVVREIRNFRTFSTAFKMNIACERPPQYRILDRVKRDGAIGGFNYPTYVHIAPDIDYLERAYEDARHGWYSSQPFLTPVVPTIVDDTLAPPGKHVVNLFGGHAPHG